MSDDKEQDILHSLTRIEVHSERLQTKLTRLEQAYAVLKDACTWTRNHGEKLLVVDHAAAKEDRGTMWEIANYKLFLQEAALALAKAEALREGEGKGIE